MKTIIKLCLPPLAILAMSVLIFQLIVKNPPKVKQRPAEQALAINVVLDEVKVIDFEPEIESRGNVRARTSTKLISQVSGVVTLVDSSFRGGGEFDVTDTLLQLEKVDYEIAVQSAKASVTQASAALSEERARGKAALRDWKRTGNSGKPNDLVLRKPQQRSAEAALQSAKSQLKQAQLNLKRTSISAPYKGKVLSKSVSLGQYVSPGSALGDIYDPSSLEVRLPLTAEQLRLIDLAALGTDTGIKVRFNYGSLNVMTGRLTALESQVDISTRQRYVVAEFDQSIKNERQTDIAISEFVTAKIKGRKLHNVIVVDRSLVSSDGYIWVAKEGKAHRVAVEIEWSDSEKVVISKGLKEGDLLIKTALGNALPGVDIIDVNTIGTEKPKNNRTVDQAVKGVN